MGIELSAVELATFAPIMLVVTTPTNVDKELVSKAIQIFLTRKIMRWKIHMTCKILLIKDLHVHV